MLRLGLVLVSAMLFLSSCSSGNGAQVSIKFAQKSGCGTLGDQTLNENGIEKVRISVVAHGERDNTGSFLCDRVFDVATPGYMKLPLMGHATIDVHVEGFKTVAGMLTRAATGSVMNLPVGNEMVPTLRIFESQKFSCNPQVLKQGRAFHTATRLPNGMVLFVGGVVASNSDTGKTDLDMSRLFLTGSVEVWDPVDGSISSVGAPTPTPRAFH